MRTTLNIADDVLDAARERARHERRTVGEVISDLARATLITSATDANVVEPTSHYGIRPFSRRGNVIVTNELVNRLRKGDAY